MLSRCVLTFSLEILLLQGEDLQVFTLIPNFMGCCEFFKVRKEACRRRKPGSLDAEPPATSRSLKTQQHVATLRVALGRIKDSPGRAREGHCLGRSFLLPT